jgi:hypothetical protein
MDGNPKVRMKKNKEDKPLHNTKPGEKWILMKKIFELNP